MPEDGIAQIDRLRGELGDWRWMILVASALDVGLVRALDARACPERSEGALTLDELVTEFGLDRRAAYATAEALAAGGFLAVAEGRYALTAEARRLLADEADEAYLAPMVLVGRQLAADWLHLPERLKGVPPPDWRQVGGDFLASFTAYMAVAARRMAAVVAERCLTRFPAARQVLDVGGGPGTYAREFIARGRTVTIIDVPEVIERVRPQWSDADPVRLVGGDFNVGLPSGPFDLALLGNICHQYGPAENQQLFRRVAAELAPDGGVALIEYVRGRSPGAALFGVNMLVHFPTGGTWTEAQYGEWLAAAGFGQITVEDIGGPAWGGSHLILARRISSKGGGA